MGWVAHALLVCGMWLQLPVNAYSSDEEVPAPAREDRQLLPPAVLFDNPYQQLPAALFDIPSERARPPALKVIFYFK